MNRIGVSRAGLTNREHGVIHSGDIGHFLAVQADPPLVKLRSIGGANHVLSISGYRDHGRSSMSLASRCWVGVPETAWSVCRR
ncbi:hypothetical protein JOF56_008811 [Kibdelosporangium banguiense]|uniref:Uncharacterized protein n=1 Tax=Kibdelosporangium banguiense TaxID=1365924 RepID=A0ABS4TVI6_9PSEU|nr:hypothetical protein [Kibdelosporangium banguiense]